MAGTENFSSNDSNLAKKIKCEQLKIEAGPTHSKEQFYLQWSWKIAAPPAIHGM